MATFTASLNSASNTTGTIRATSAFFEGTLTAAGWVQTADTGQSNSSNYTAGVTGTSSGYQIWRMNDSFQASYPIYMKLELGGGGSATANTGVWVTIGTGSDGAGNITGVLISRTSFAQGQGTSAGTATSYGSGTTSRLTVALTPLYSGSVPSIVMNIERSRDASGNHTNDGVMAQFLTYSFVWSAYASFSGTNRAPQTSLTLPVYNGITSLVNGNTVGLVPILPFGRTGAMNPGYGLMIFYGPDTASNNIITATIRSTSRTYFMAGAMGTYGAASTLWANSYPAVLFE